MYASNIVFSAFKFLPQFSSQLIIERRESYSGRLFLQNLPLSLSPDSQKNTNISEAGYVRTLLNEHRFSHDKPGIKHSQGKIILELFYTNYNHMAEHAEN